MPYRTLNGLVIAQELTQKAPRAYKVLGAFLGLGLCGLLSYVHWLATASAMPLEVLDRILARSALSGNFHILCSLPLTILVGVNGGRLWSHRQVALVSPCPNCQGCMIWVGFVYCVDIIPTGFSIAQGQDKRVNCIKKAIEACCVPFALFSANHLAPELAKFVHGGKANTRSHCCASSGSTSLCICLLRTALSAWLDGCRSQLVTLWPLAINRLLTVPDSSQATSISIGYPKY